MPRSPDESHEHRRKNYARQSLDDARATFRSLTHSKHQPSVADGILKSTEVVRTVGSPHMPVPHHDDDHPSVRDGIFRISFIAVAPSRLLGTVPWFTHDHSEGATNVAQDVGNYLAQTLLEDASGLDSPRPTSSSRPRNAEGQAHPHEKVAHRSDREIAPVEFHSPSRASTLRIETVGEGPKKPPGLVDRYDMMAYTTSGQKKAMIALFDTQAGSNFIRVRKAQVLGHEIKPYTDNVEFRTGTGQILMPIGKVELTWHFVDNEPHCRPWKTYDNTFLVVNGDDVPFDVLLGFEFLKAAEIYKMNLRLVCPMYPVRLTPKDKHDQDVKKAEQKAANQAEKEKLKEERRQKRAAAAEAGSSNRSSGG